MSSTFGGLTRATTALWAAQRGLDVTGQNISNVNTAGYSRQRVEQSSMNGATLPAIWSVSDGVGSGVDSNTVLRIRDAFLEARGRLETATTARLTVQSAAFTRIEQAFREPGDTGIQSMLADVFSGFSDVANHPLDEAPRRQVMERLATLAAGIRTTASTLDKQWDDTRTALGTMVTDVNATARSIADLNTKIQSGTLSGSSVNELVDKRDGLVMKLAEQVGATAVAKDGGMVDVVVGGTTLVSGRSAIGLALEGSSGIGGVAGDPPRLVTVPGGTTVQPGGTAEGQLSVLTTVVPTYRQALDSLASGLADALNSAHAAGFDLAGNPGEPLVGNGPGTGAVDPLLVTAANITVRITDPRALAAAGPSPSGATTANGNNADALYRLSLDPVGVNATYRELIVGLGVQSAVAARDLQVQTVVRDQVDAARESVAGVNLDEEMTNMMAYQHAYAAAARLVTAIDEALNTLINGTGVVGR
ncbi:flagellar hook-associated protein FlgK [Trujillonella humicola]|uniref:flagellar hook-associated protein FlgK n=1 Tax=Trujillonella humicola TaxID=3383699 RepID=UPI003906A2D8